MDNILRSVFLLCTLAFQATVAEQIIYAQVGEDVSLNLPDTSDKWYFYWYFKDKNIAALNPSGGKQSEWGTRLSLSPQSLVIRNLTREDFGSYTCTVRNKMTDVKKVLFRLIQLNVAVNPLIALPGELLSLTCDAGSQDPTPHIYWVGPKGQRMEGGKHMVQADGSHSGEWTCVVANAGREKRVKIKVTVIDLLPPTPTLTQFTSALKPLTIPCSLAADSTWDKVKSRGIYEVGWNFCPRKPQSVKSSLFLLPLENDKLTWKTQTDWAPWPSPNPSSGDFSLGGKLAPEGDYECFAKFQNGVTLNRTVRVEVLRIIASPGTQLSTGQQLNLTCTTGYPLPSDVQLQWFPPKETSSSSSSPDSLSPSALDLRSPILSLRGVGRDHNGTWRCELRRGEASLTSAVVVVKIEPKFNAWMLVTLCAAATILILLVILIVILQRRKQRRTRRHKRLCRCPNPKPKGFYRS